MLIWRSPSLSELTSMIFNKGLTHLGSEASIYSNSFIKNGKHSLDLGKNLTNYDVSQELYENSSIFTEIDRYCHETIIAI